MQLFAVASTQSAITCAMSCLCTLYKQYKSQAILFKGLSDKNTSCPPLSLSLCLSLSPHDSPLSTDLPVATSLHLPSPMCPPYFSWSLAWRDGRV